MAKPPLRLIFGYYKLVIEHFLACWLQKVYFATVRLLVLVQTASAVVIHSFVLPETTNQ
jgi:hypothetical protein